MNLVGVLNTWAKPPCGIPALVNEAMQTLMNKWIASTIKIFEDKGLPIEPEDLLEAIKEFEKRLIDQGEILLSITIPVTR